MILKRVAASFGRNTDASEKRCEISAVFRQPIAADKA